MKIKLEVEESELQLLDVPEQYTDFKIAHYGFAGTYLMETNSTGLNHLKIKIPNGKYRVLGFLKDILIDDIETDKNFALLKIQG